MGRRPGSPGSDPDPRAPAPTGVPADADGDPALPPLREGPAGPARWSRCERSEPPRWSRCERSEPRDPGLRPDAARLPGRAPLHPLLRAALHGAARGSRVVVRPRGGAGLPRALPLLLPLPPRHAQRLRVADVAHRLRRLAPLRREGRRRAGDLRRHDPPRRQGHLAARDTGRRRGHRRQRRGVDVRRRRGRHAPPPGPGAARRAHLGPPRGAGRDALRPQHGSAAHRHLADAPADPDLGLMEFHAARRRPGACRRQRRRGGHLRPDPPAAAAHRHPLPRDAGRRAPRRPEHRDRPDGVRAPALHPRVGRRAGSAARARHRPGRLRRGLPRLGVPRGRCALRPGRRRAAGTDLARAGGRAARSASDERASRPHHPSALPHHHQPHPARAVDAHVHPPLPHVDGRRRRAARPPSAGLRPRHLRGPRPPRVAGPHAAAEPRGVPGHRGRPPRPRRSDPAGHPAPRVRLLLQPDQRLVVPGPPRPPRGDRRGGPQHLRRPARLPRRPRRAGPGPHRQGDVRLAVPRHRRPLRAGRAAAR